jgi:hypothetical protein
METKKFLTTEKVLEYLEHEVHNAANALGVLSIDSQVWEDESNPRDGFLGYAMQEETGWQSFPLDNASAAETQETRILVMEFLGLMDQVRYSLGITQLYANTKSDSFLPEESEFFWMHYNNASITCGIASDRIRDFAVIGILEKSRRSYEKKWYVDPFKDSEKHLQELCVMKELGGITDQLVHEYAEEIKILPKNAEEIALLRKNRNRIIHDWSTKGAKDLKHREERFKNHPEVPSAKEIESRVLEERARIMTSLSQSMDELKHWYDLLVKVGDLVFQAEHMIRKWKDIHQA